MKPLWKIKFFTGSMTFVSTELEMEFENEVQIERLFSGHESSPDIAFSPTDVYKKEIKIKFVNPVPYENDLMIWLRAEKQPVFKKVIWWNKHNNHHLEFTQDQIKQLNDQISFDS